MTSKMNPIRTTLLILSFSLTTTLFSAEPTEAPEVKRISETIYQLGDIHFDQTTREIWFPAEINLNDQTLLEFALVHEKGKTHESLLSTKTSPTQLNIVFKLLSYGESEELFEIVDKGELTGKFPEVSEEQKAASRFNISVEWEKDKKKQSASLNDWIMNLTTKEPMSVEAWINHGSYMIEKNFHAETEGSFFAIYKERGALMSYSGAGNDNDENWTAIPDRLPPVGTPLTLRIKPIKP